MKSFVVSIVILLGGALVAGSILGANLDFVRDLRLASGGERTKEDDILRNRLQFAVSPSRSEQARSKGDLAAPIKIVEFSDFECTFCRGLHPTLSRLLEEYPDVVQWEYRHLPLVIHINARDAALAAECVGDLAGNDAFWEYAEILFENQRGLVPTFYSQAAIQFGIEPTDLESCMKDPGISARLLADEQIALALGAGGTPFNVVVYPDGSSRPVSGALPYEQWVSLIEEYEER